MTSSCRCATLAGCEAAGACEASLDALAVRSTAAERLYAAQAYASRYLQAPIEKNRRVAPSSHHHALPVRYIM